MAATICRHTVLSVLVLCFDFIYSLIEILFESVTNLGIDLAKLKQTAHCAQQEVSEVLPRGRVVWIPLACPEQDQPADWLKLIYYMLHGRWRTHLVLFMCLFPI